LGTWLTGRRVGEVLVLGNRFEVEGVPREVVDQAEQEPPAPRPPQLAEVNPSESEIDLYRPAVPRKARSEASASPGSIPWCSL
jgi:hypothetical protein